MAKNIDFVLENLEGKLLDYSYFGKNGKIFTYKQAKKVRENDFVEYLGGEVYGSMMGLCRNEEYKVVRIEKTKIKSINDTIRDAMKENPNIRLIKLNNNSIKNVMRDFKNHAVNKVKPPSLIEYQDCLKSKNHYQLIIKTRKKVNEEVKYYSKKKVLQVRLNGLKKRYELKSDYKICEVTNNNKFISVVLEKDDRISYINNLIS